MTEADTESIWDTTLDTTRFGKINVRMGELLNFYVNQDAATDITSTAVLPILEQISEECLIDLIAAAKMDKVTNPWDFIAANVTAFMARKLSQHRGLLQMVRDTLNGRMQIVTRNLPDKNDRTY